MNVNLDADEAIRRLEAASAAPELARAIVTVVGRRLHQPADRRSAPSP